MTPLWRCIGGTKVSRIFCSIKRGCFLCPVIHNRKFIWTLKFGYNRELINFVPRPVNVRNKFQGGQLEESPKSILLLTSWKSFLINFCRLVEWILRGGDPRKIQSLLLVLPSLLIVPKDWPLAALAIRSASVREVLISDTLKQFYWFCERTSIRRSKSHT